MSVEPSVIDVEGLSKAYRLGVIGRETLRDEALYWWHRARGRDPAQHMGKIGASAALPHTDDPERTLIWALRDVSFSVRKGEVVGIIGRNGSGKSTLLKLLSRITGPTAGRATIDGRVGSLLEVGTGFHPELTGRDNIYMNGAILGMKKAEIRRKFDEIVQFAEVERFLDTPVKRYSSGMYVRLAFAVAAHLEPEILIVDEVLAVGDAAFQKRCLGKMGDAARHGRTVLFVSHNMTAVQALCGRAIWLDGGRLVAEGPTDDVVARYLGSSAAAHAEQFWPDPATAPGNDEVRLRRARLAPASPVPPDQLSIDDPFDVEIEFWNRRPGARLVLVLSFHNQDDLMLFRTVVPVDPAQSGGPTPEGLLRCACHMPGSLLNDGSVHLDLIVYREMAGPVYTHENLLAFDVHDSAQHRGTWHRKWPGAVRPLLTWTIAAGER
jgi:lipopolysaccharide transport system ATP-binding protein